MTRDDEVDVQLREQFQSLQRDDAAQAPSFADTIGRARAAAAQGGTRGAARGVSKKRWRWAMVLVPAAAAAGFVALWLGPARAADREFERAVSEWSRAGGQLASPTDGLLAVPGLEYLRRIPPLGTGGLPAERRRTS